MSRCAIDFFFASFVVVDESDAWWIWMKRPQKKGRRNEKFRTKTHQDPIVRWSPDFGIVSSDAGLSSLVIKSPFVNPSFRSCRSSLAKSLRVFKKKVDKLFRPPPIGSIESLTSLYRNAIELQVGNATPAMAGQHDTHFCPSPVHFQWQGIASVTDCISCF